VEGFGGRRVGPRLLLEAELKSDLGPVTFPAGVAKAPFERGPNMQKTLFVVLAVLVLGAATAMALEKPASKPQTTCPVTGKAIDPKTSLHVDWQGQRIYFADQAAVDAFRKDPEKVFATIAAEGVRLQNIQTTCPVSGENLEGGDMGPPVAFGYKGRTIMFCCNMCPPRFDKEPAKYLAALPGEQPKAN
jgi:YHS domain-containing protein